MQHSKQNSISLNFNVRGHRFTGAISIFANLTEASNGKEIKASNWSNLHFDEPPAFSNITDANMVGEMFSCMRESVLLVNFDFKKKYLPNMNIY